MDVVKILEKYKEGSTRQFDVFLNALENPDIESSILLSFLRGLRENISLLDKEFEILVGVTLNINWSNKDLTVVQEYQSYLLNLVSAHTYYLQAVLRMLIKHFIPKIPKQAVGDSESVDKDVREKYLIVFSNVHRVLRGIYSIVPMTPKILLPLLLELYPYIGLHVYVQECYVRNLLAIISYIHNYRQQILDLIVDKMLKFDVRAPRHAIQEGDSTDEELEEELVFDMDDKQTKLEVSMDDVMDVEEVKPMTHKEAEKLDSVMELLFQYIHNVCFENGELNWQETKKLYRELLLVFERKILPTHGPAHVQFIMFYLSSLRQEICDGFLDYLWKKVQDPSTYSVFRIAAVSYMGSLLSRAVFVPISTVASCLDLMCNWIHRYLEQGTQEIHADIVHHGPFYYVCQTVFYTFLFRNKEIFSMKRGYKFAASLNFQRIVTSRLNPLRVCQPYTVKCFASIMRMHQLAFCDTVIERNNRCRLPVVAYSGSGKGNLVDTLEPFFPFDPYLLSRSGKWIQSLQRQYQGPDLEDNNEKSEDDENDDDFLIDALSSKTVTADIASSLSSELDFMDFGTSPGFRNPPVL